MSIFNLKVGILSIAALMVGCQSTTDLPESSTDGVLIKGQHAPAPIRHDYGDTYIRTDKSNAYLKNRIVSYSTVKPVTLRTAIVKAFGDVEVIPRDRGVDLGYLVDVRANNMKGKDYLEYLEGITGYDVEWNNKVVSVSSFVRKQWRLATFASDRRVTNRSVLVQSAGEADLESNSGGEQSSTLVEMNITDDEWKDLLEGATELVESEERIESEDDEDTDFANDSLPPADESLADQGEFDSLSSAIEASQENTQEGEKGEFYIAPYVKGIRSVGVVAAGGSPYLIEALDRYFTEAVELSKVVFDVKVKGYEVTLNHEKSRGIDWDLLVNGSINGNPLTTGISQTIADPTNTNSFWESTGSFVGDRGSLDWFVRFLEDYGEVELTEQPSISVRNGVPAQLYNGTELSYVTDTEQTQDENGNPTVTFDLTRRKVGVSISVIARKLEDDQILVDVWPVVSVLSGIEDEFIVGETEFSIPRIDLREFSTQLITTSGTPIHLGGLISKKLSTALKGIPSSEGSRGFWKSISEDIENELERRESVWVVTPTIVSKGS